MKELIDNILEKKLADGTIDKIIEEELTKAIKNSIHNALYDSTSYRGEVTNKIKDMVTPMLTGAVEKYDFGELVAKIIASLDKTLDDSIFGKAVRNLVDNANILPLPNFEWRQEITVNDLLKYYEEYALHQIEREVDKDDLEFEEGSATISFEITLEKDEESEKATNYYLTNNEFYKLQIEDIDCSIGQDVLDENTITFKVDKIGRIYFDCGDVSINRIKYLPKIFLILYLLTANNCRIKDLTNFSKKECYLEINEYE